MGAIKSRLINRTDVTIPLAGMSQPIKIDLNSSDILDYRHVDGVTIDLAKEIISNVPYDTVKDVLKIPTLTKQEVDVLKHNLHLFRVSPAYLHYVDRHGIYQYNNDTFEADNH